MHKVKDVASRVKGSGLKPPTQYLGRLGLCLYPKALGTHILRLLGLYKDYIISGFWAILSRRVKGAEGKTEARV